MLDAHFERNDVAGENIGHSLFATCLAGFACFLASSTLVLMLCHKMAFSFSTACFGIGLAAALTVTAMTFQICRQARRLQSHGQRWHFAGALTLAMLSGVLAMSINRPDIDDSIYVPKSLYYLEHPDAPIDSQVTWLAAVERRPISGVFPYYELSQAALAHLTGRPYLDFYHVIFPGIVGFLMGSAALVLLGLFEKRSGTVLICGLFYLLLMLLLGETHRSYGNLSIARAFHGKYMFLSVGAPSWIYFSLRYLRKPSWPQWLILAALGVAMAAATPTAMIFLPFLALTIAFANHMQASGRLPGAEHLALALRYGATLLPVVAMAISFRFYAVDNIAAGSQINAGFPKSFADQFRFIINPDYPITPWLFAASLMAVLAFSPYRRFFAAWTLALGVMLLNPLISDSVIHYLTTENIYWRLFYLLPFPLLPALALGLLFNAGRIGAALALSMISITAFFALWGPTSVLRVENGATLSTPGYKIGEADRATSEQAIRCAYAGTTLAPIPIASNMLLLSAKFPQYVMREDYLVLMLASVPSQVPLEQRNAAGAYLYLDDKSTKAASAFQTLISSPLAPEHILTKESAINFQTASTQLIDAGYTNHCGIAGGYRLFSRARGDAR
ncbi:DUF6077 domain-containing protein [Xanthomonas sp. 3075]|uniref:DUF6077 domain-containing protein n=1 Tax=Xanthomonas sp. 3075 TaxID=3035315 RepID=UPI00161A8D74|nr:DUF6077 domain-containing protein [Xanthomonas sp. 3075]MBB4131435.1 hypothetical protein [Xanthomonas sp. 3075]